MVKYPVLENPKCKLLERPEPTPAQVEERVAPFRKIVAEWQRQPIRWQDSKGKKRQSSVDATTASAVVTVFEQSTPEQRLILCRLEPHEMINFAWRCVR